MKTLITAAAVLVASVASAQVAVTTAEAINVEPNQARAFTAVCAAAYSQASGQPVTTPVDQPVAGERVELQLIGLDGTRSRRILVRAQKKNADDSIAYEASLDALSMEDAPVVCERLANSLVNRVPVDQTQDMNNVTAVEAKARRRRTGTVKSFGLKTGFMGAVASNATLSPMGTIAFDARIEGDHFFTQLGVGALIPAPIAMGDTSYGGVTLDMGAGYYFTNTDFAPYVALGLQPRIIFGGSIINFVPYAQVGFTTSRKSGVRFNVDGRVGQNLLPVSNPDGNAVRPTEFSLNVGVGF
ncbi:MAG: hypothetical protein ACO1OB_16850 [Archangium sp.]